MNPWVALAVSVLALLVACGTLAGVLLGERARAADRCSRCRHFRWHHRAEGCTACGCEGYQ